MKRFDVTFTEMGRNPMTTSWVTTSDQTKADCVKFFGLDGDDIVSYTIKETILYYTDAQLSKKRGLAELLFFLVCCEIGLLFYVFRSIVFSRQIKVPLA